ncbi:hypothetical protein F5X98DRAFT_52486 [Xylaria grammica]|nr:hypothetical protein F5X98DRAFT_52486 [Xylaria grammica]
MCLLGIICRYASRMNHFHFITSADPRCDIAKSQKAVHAKEAEQARKIKWQRPFTATNHHLKASSTSLLHTHLPWRRSCATMRAVDSTPFVNISTQAYLAITTAVLALSVSPMNVRSLRNLEITSYAFFSKRSIFQLMGTSLSISKIESFYEEDPAAFPSLAFCSRRSTRSQRATVCRDWASIISSSKGLSCPRPSPLCDFAEIRFL